MSSFISEVPVPLNTLSLWSKGALSEYLRQDAITAADVSEIWQSLIRSLTTPTLSEKQITSICNCLRVFLKSSVSSQNAHVKNLLLVRDEWMGCYAAVCDAWPRAKAKPLVQLLEVLLQIAKNAMPADEIDSIWKSISLELSAVILSGQPTRDFARALYLTSFFLEKNLPYEIYHESIQRNRMEGKRRAVETDTEDMEPQKALIYAVLLSFKQHEAQSSAEKCFRTLLKANNQYASEPQPWWLLVKDFASDHVDSLDAIANSVFPALLEQQPLGYVDVIKLQRPLGDRVGLLFLLALLQSLREGEVINQYDLLGYLQQPIFGQISAVEDTPSLLLSHADDGVRVRTLRLLATSKMTNDPVSLQILHHLEASIPLWFRLGGSRERGELLSTVRRFLIRLRGGSSTLGKSAHLSPVDRELLDAHEKFVQALITSVLDELRPNASYQRRIMGLSIFKHLLDSKIDRCDRTAPEEVAVTSSVENSPLSKVRGDAIGSNDPDWPFSLCLRKMSSVQDLLNLASDAYEDIRALSSSILRHLLTEANNSHSKAFSEQLYAALTLLIPSLESQAAQTNRSDHADGLGRLYALLELTRKKACRSGVFTADHENSVSAHLVSRLERVLKDKSILDKPDPEPLHGLLFGVMYCITDSNAVRIHKRVINICGLVWKAVAARLCVDSPEMTDEDADDFEAAVTGPKDMLSYSWRALGGTSLLLRALLNSPQGLETTQFLQDLNAIGALCMEQLTMLRHRGAFSTVAQTFTICCQRTMDIQGLELLGLRLQWYQEAEAQVDQQADRLTRRSAGLPAMIASILSPDDDESFRTFINSFIARSQITEAVESSETIRLSLPQVHAMNTLREVIINSRFRNVIGPHLQKLLGLATKNLGSNIWAIQNCGLMLYRACLLKFSVDDEGEPLIPKTLKPSGNSSIPLELALELLHSGPSLAKFPSNPLTPAGPHNWDYDSESLSVGVEQKFAALDLLSPMKEVNLTIRTDLFQLLSSPIWLVRERAAVVLAVLTPVKELQKQFGNCLDHIKLETSQNSLHGILLYGRQVLGEWLSGNSNSLSSSTLDHIIQTLLFAMERASKRNIAPPVWAVMFEIANDVIESSSRTDVKTTLSLFDRELSSSTEIRNSYLAERALLYNTALHLITTESSGLQQEDQVFSAFLERMTGDPVIAGYVLQRLLKQGRVFQPQELLLLSQILSSRTHVNAFPFAIDMVSLSVERSPSEWDNTKGEQLLDLLESSSRTREIDASNIVARARLLSLLAFHNHDLDLNVLRRRSRFERDVRQAASDKMDTHARLQAAKALSAYLSCQPLTGFEHFAMLFALRDLLSDDDEEVRSSAARTTSSFLRRKQFEVLAEGLCAPAASIRLENYLLSLLCDHSLPQEILLLRLLGVDSGTSLEAFLRMHPVEDQLKVIKDDARALFAVEKQNLYIDEVHEIHFWTSMCKANIRKQHDPLPESLESALGLWLIDGLRTVRTLLSNIEEIAMLPDLTFNLDILIICLQVASVACAYLSSRRVEIPRHATDLTYQSIQQHLCELVLLASQRHFNPELTRSLNRCLEVVVR